MNKIIVQKITTLENKSTNLKNKLKNENDYANRIKIKSEILKLETRKKNSFQKMRKTIAIEKNNLQFLETSISNIEKNLAKINKMFQRYNDKFILVEKDYQAAKNIINDYKQQKSTKISDRQSNYKLKKLNNKSSSLNLKIQNKIEKEKSSKEKFNNIKVNLELYNNEINQTLEKEFLNFLEEAKKTNDEILINKIKQEHGKIKKQTNKKQEKLNNRLQKSSHQTITKEIDSLKAFQATMNDEIIEFKAKNDEALKRIDDIKKQKKIIVETNLLLNDLKAVQKIQEKSKKLLTKRINQKNNLANLIKTISTLIGIDALTIPIKNSWLVNAFNVSERLLLKDWFFAIITGVLGAGVVLATYLYITTGVGALNEINIVQMLEEGLKTGNYSTAIGFASGFLIARILEGPLVGILDVGGSLLTGLGIGIPAVFLSIPALNFMMYNPFLALLIGLVGGLLIGTIIIIIRLIKPKESAGLGTDIMIGAGNATGKFLGPLVIFSAAMFNPLVGIGAGIGAVLFIWWKKPTVGGAIIGAIIFGIIPAFL